MLRRLGPMTAMLAISVMTFGATARGAERTVAATSATVTMGTGGTVAETLSLSLPSTEVRMTFPNAFTGEQTTDRTLTVTSTAGNAVLRVADARTATPTRLVAFGPRQWIWYLQRPLQVAATSASGTGQPYSVVGGFTEPTAIQTWSAPVANEPVAVTFKQEVAGEAISGLPYTATLVFSLTTTDP
ncbi:hypothetical protein DVA67_031535 [Solirubrobacter sp. CPCC 204708]|nr:hypothetical protein [Solirubrobacter deserti]